MINIYSRIDISIIKEIRKRYGNDSVFLHHTGKMFGIGASSYSIKAINKINTLKRRNENKHELKSFIILFDCLDKVKQFVDLSKLEKLAFQYWPGNLTIIVDEKKGDFGHLCKNKQIAVRVPDSHFLRKFIDFYGEPIISTSVNVSKNQPINSFSEIIKLNWFDFAVLEKNKSEDVSLDNVNQSASTIVRQNNGNLEIIREGSLKSDEVKKSFKNPLVTFICTGNICRSPMAEYYFNRAILKTNKNFVSKSAGFYQSGVRISENSKLVMKSISINSQKHLSRKINKDIMRQSYLLLTMTEDHKLALVKEFPQFKHKVFTLTGFADLKGDIQDPYGGSLEIYQEVFNKIKYSVDKIIQKIS